MGGLRKVVQAWEGGCESGVVLAEPELAELQWREDRISEVMCWLSPWVGVTG